MKIKTNLRAGAGTSSAAGNHGVVTHTGIDAVAPPAPIAPPAVAPLVRCAGY